MFAYLIHKINFSEVIDSTKDLVLLKYSLQSFSYILPAKNDSILETLEKLIRKLETSDNGYVHGSLGNYYLFKKKVICIMLFDSMFKMFSSSTFI